MKVLGISGSPRAGGNTDIILGRALEGATSSGAETESVFVRELNISFCRECRSCSKTGECVINDDIKRIFLIFKDIDHLILASPIFFYGLPAQLKALIDRAQHAWSNKYILKRDFALKKKDKRRGLFLGVGATKGERLFEGSIRTVKYFFDAIDIRYAGEVLVRGVDKKGEISQYPKYLEEAYQAGEKLAKSSPSTTLRAGE